MYSKEKRRKNKILFYDNINMKFLKYIPESYFEV